MSYNQGRFYVSVIVILCVQIVFTIGAKRTTRKCECGRHANKIQIAPRIVGGQLADPHDYPWLALILYMNVAMCGGSVINNYYILTAAHCAQPYKASFMSVILGVHDRIQMNQGSERIYKVAKSIVHPNHLDHNTYDENDIALLKLDRMIKYDNYIEPICLPRRGQDFTHKAAIVAGWGRVEDGGFSTRYLHDITVEILSTKQCAKSEISNLFLKLPNQVLCAYERKTDSCQGDSGGPLVTRVSENSMVQIGIVSFGKICGGKSSPGAYTKVTYYLDWIENTTKDALYCRGLNDGLPRKKKDKRNWKRVHSRKNKSEKCNYYNVEYCK